MISLRILSLDLSLVSTGLCHPDGSTKPLVFGTRKKGADVQHFELTRLSWLVSQIVIACQDAKPDLVAIESPILRSSAALVLGELHGAIKVALHAAGIPLIVIPATSIKQYATGKGNAQKSDMVLAGFKRAGLDGITEDEVDAWWLRAIASDLLGCPVLEVPEAHRKSLAKLYDKIPASVAALRADLALAA